MHAHTQTSKLQTSKVHSDVVSVQAVIYLRLFSCYKNRIWLLSYLVIVENIHMMYVQHFQCTELHWPHRLKGGETSDLSEKKPTSTCRIWIHFFLIRGRIRKLKWTDRTQSGLRQTPQMDSDRAQATLKPIQNFGSRKQCEYQVWAVGFFLLLHQNVLYVGLKALYDHWMYFAQWYIT